MDNFDSWFNEKSWSEKFIELKMNEMKRIVRVSSIEWVEQVEEGVLIHMGSGASNFIGGGEDVPSSAMYQRIKDLMGIEDQ